MWTSAAPKAPIDSDIDHCREAVILAGGKGVRLRPYTTLLPKPLVPIGEDHSILEIVLRQLAECGFTRAVLAIGHLGQLVRAYVGDGSQWGIQVDYHTEEAPLGTIGPALRIADELPEEFLLMNGDILTDLDFGALLEYHRGTRAPMTVATYEREHRVDFGVLDVDGCSVRGFTEKPSLRYSVSMGVYALSRSTLADYTAGLPFGFDELILDQISRGRTPASYPFDGYWLDIGRPDDYDRANEEFPAIKDSLFGPGRARRTLAAR
ncbi:MAG TPA: sugar phosphate nucleotidyltransferase [Acidimicrobiales bacterium]|nr:sugar phosphate nucleotidyltransferase [Acidimicrobiales bacterium]